MGTYYTRNINSAYFFGFESDSVLEVIILYFLSSNVFFLSQDFVNTSDLICESFVNM